MAPRWMFWMGLGLLCGLWPPEARSAEPNIVAVFRIEDKSGALDTKQIDTLTEYLGNTVGEEGIFQIIPSTDIKRLLQEKKSDSYKACFDRQCQVELGQELAANKTLSTSILKIGEVCTVSAGLYDLKRMATDITVNSKTTCQEQDLMKAIEEVAAKIRAFGVGKAPGSSGTEGPIGPKASDWNPAAGKEGIVAFSSEPTGATVLVDEQVLCKETPCSRSVSLGAHRVSMQAERHRPLSQQVVIAPGAKVHWKLEPDFGWLTIRSDPAGLPVRINTQPAGQTPIERRELGPGTYAVTLASPCFLESGERVSVRRNETQEITLKPVPRQGAIQLRAVDERGNDLEAEVFIDGVRIGLTPGLIKTSICARELWVKHPTLGETRRGDLKVQEKQVLALTVTLKPIDLGVVLIPAGWFLMGCDPKRDRDCQDNEKPQHKVWLDEYSIDKNEVSVEQYRACVSAGKCTPPRGNLDWNLCNWESPRNLKQPVNCVTWHQAQAYCAWKGMHLPTEAEWEKAARGPDGLKYPWGNDPEPDCERAVINLGNRGCYRDSTWEVGSKAKGASPFGVLDLAGNVQEWVADWYAERTDPQAPDKNPTGARQGEMRVLKGGTWSGVDFKRLRASSRVANKPDAADDDTGFRCAK